MSETKGRLVQLASFIESEAGRDALEDTCQQAGLSKTVREASQEINPEAEAVLVRHACEVLGDLTFGARAGLKIGEPGSLSSFISKFSKDLRSAIENSQRYYSTLDTSHAYSLLISGNSASFVLERIDPSFTKGHRYTEFLLFGALNRMRTITGTHLFPIEMRFEHDVKDIAVSIEKLAGVPVMFGAEKSEIILPLSSLDLPIPTYNPALTSHLMQYGERLLGEHKDQNPSLRARVEGILANSLPGRLVPAVEVATNLGMSPRTFARRLKDEGLSFRSIVDDLRCGLAKSYLSDGFSIAEVAFYLDYSDQAAFSTAFKRWTGESPSAFAASRLQSTHHRISHERTQI